MKHPIQIDPRLKLFCIGPIFGTDNLEDNKEFHEYKGLMKLMEILETKYDYLLFPDKLYRGNDGYLLFSTRVKFIVQIPIQTCVVYFLQDEYGQQTSSESISIDVRQMRGRFEDGRRLIYLIFSQYWDGKAPRLLSSLFAEVKLIKEWSHEKIFKFELDESNKKRHTNWNDFIKIGYPDYDTCFNGGKLPWNTVPKWMYKNDDDKYHTHSQTKEIVEIK